MNQLQQDFEEWATSYHGAYNLGKVTIPVLVYSNHNVHHDWDMWQRVHNIYHKDIVVEFPPTIVLNGSVETVMLDDDNTYYSVSEIKRMFDKLGIKYKNGDLL